MMVMSDKILKEAESNNTIIFSEYYIKKISWEHLDNNTKETLVSLLGDEYDGLDYFTYLILPEDEFPDFKSGYVAIFECSPSENLLEQYLQCIEDGNFDYGIAPVKFEHNYL